MTKAAKQILLIEDNLEIIALIEEHLPNYQDSFALEIATTGTAGLERALSGVFDVLLLDIMLPGLGGIDICKQVRQADQDLPIIMLTAKSSELDRVLGLEIGADDYLVKPFSVPELFSRVEALLRRQTYTEKEGRKQPAVLEFGELSINRDGQIVRIDGKTIELTPTEFTLLLFLADRVGEAFNRYDLLKAVWGDTSSGAEDMVNAHINRLRRKLSSDRQKYIKTVWGVGYRFVTIDEHD